MFDHSLAQKCLPNISSSDPPMRHSMGQAAHLATRSDRLLGRLSRAVNKYTVVKCRDSDVVAGPCSHSCLLEVPHVHSYT